MATRNLLSEDTTAEDPTVEFRALMTQKIVKEWTAESTDGGFPITLTGPCPHCAHSVSTLVPGEVVGLAGADGPATRLAVLVRCTCGQEHEDQTEAANCRHWWLVDLVCNEGEYSLKVPDDDKDLIAAKELAKAQSTMLVDTRASAKEWLAGTAAIYGLFSISSVSFAADSIASLDPRPRLLFLVASGLALIVAVASILWTYAAAFGFPEVWSTKSDDLVKRWMKHLDEAPKKSARNLQLGILAAIAALTMLAIATGIILYNAKPVT